jgi:adenylate cyclase
MANAFPAAYLEAEIGGQVQQFALAPDRGLRIGRSEKNDVVLNDDLTSRGHAMIQQSGDGLYYVTDLGSSNGTFVNGNRISAPAMLRSADRVGIGHHEFIFHQPMLVDYPAPARSDGMESTNILFSQSLMTVLVADVRGFTGLSQRVDADTLSKLTGFLFRQTGKALQARGAWAQKYIGDAVMAVWLHQRREPELCDLIAVFEGIEQLARITGALQAHFGLAAPVRFGAGINTGWAALGNVGSIASSDYTALGETVNRAFRLESCTKGISRDLAIGQGTYDILKRAAPMDKYFAPVTVRLKGYEDETTVYAADFACLPALLGALREAPTLPHE